MKIIKNILKYSLIAGLFAVPFIAFIFPTAMFFPFITGKGFVFRILIEILFGLFILLSLADRDYRPKFSWITKSVLFFALAILVSDLLGVNSYKSLWSNYERMEGFVLIIHLAMYYLVASSVLRTTLRWNQFINTSIVASAMMSVYATFQVLGKITINQGGSRVDATFGNATYLAIYLVFHIFLCLYMLLGEATKKWQKWAYAAIAVFEMFILYFTATRGAILGLIGGLILAGFLMLWKEKENKALRKWAYGILAGIAIVVVGFITVHNVPAVKSNPVLSRFATLSLNEFKTQGRYYVWPMAIKGVAERPIFGWGQEGFNFVFNKYYNPGMAGMEEWFDRTHDVVLDWLIAGGIVGFLAYVSMFVALFYYIWRKKSVLKLSEKSILTGMISAYIFHNIFVFDNLISYILFFSILAYLHSVSVKDTEPSSRFHTKVFSNDVLNYIALPVVVIVTLCTVYYVNVPALLANRALIQAISPQSGGAQKNLDLFKEVYSYNSFGSTEATEQLIQVATQIASSQLPDTFKQEFLNFAKTKIEEKIKESPHDARYLVFAGSFFNRVGAPDEAIKYLDRAMIESPNKQSIYFELGSSYILKKDYKKMFELFKKAYELKPSVPESRIIYAIGAIYTQNGSALKEVMGSIDQGAIIGDNRFIKAYADVGDYNSVVVILNARLEKDPNNMQYKLSLASAYALMGQKQKAISIIQQMIDQDPTFKDQGNQYIQQIQAS